MNWSKHGRDGSGRSYHHGNLKEALVYLQGLGLTALVAPPRSGSAPG